jgi:hypothetical protein
MEKQAGDQYKRHIEQTLTVRGVAEATRTLFL